MFKILLLTVYDVDDVDKGICSFSNIFFLFSLNIFECFHNANCSVICLRIGKVYNESASTENAFKANI